jgi:hypothetical protein
VQSEGLPLHGGRQRNADPVDTTDSLSQGGAVDYVIVAIDDNQAFIPVYLHEDDRVEEGYGWTPSIAYAQKFLTKGQVKEIFDLLIWKLMDMSFRNLMKEAFPSGKGRLVIGTTTLQLTDHEVNVGVF